MNRKERREYAKEVAKEPMARKCPMCGKKSLFVTIPKKEWKCDIQCVLCEGIIKENCGGLLPNTYIDI